MIQLYMVVETKPSYPPRVTFNIPLTHLRTKNHLFQRKWIFKGNGVFGDPALWHQQIRNFAVHNLSRVIIEIIITSFCKITQFLILTVHEIYFFTVDNSKSWEGKNTILPPNPF